MKKILILISVSLAILLIGSYFYPIILSPPEAKSLWDMVPADAVIIYENGKQTFAKNTPEIASRIQAVLRQDSILASTLRTRATIISAHIIGKENFGILYYHPDSAILQIASFRKLTSPAKRKKRIFEGFTINELTTPNNGILSFSMVDNNLIISRESFLVEDVIRVTKGNDGGGFKKKNNELFQSAPTRSGRLYVNISQLPRFCNLFVSRETNSSFFKNLGNSLVSDIKMENQTLSMNGFAMDSMINRTSSLSLFDDQRPVASEMYKIVSNRSLFCIHYGISDFNSWTKRRRTYSKANNPRMLKLQDELEPKFKLPDFYGSLGNEIAWCRLDYVGHPEDIFLLEIKDASAAKLNTILSNDLPPIENYASYPIHKMVFPELVYSLLWPITENRNLNFYCKHGKYLVFTENLDVLKKCMDDIEEDNTWGKSAEWNSFFTSSLPESNVSFVFNGTRLFPWLLGELTPQWTATVVSNEWDLAKGSFQFSRLDRNYDFNGIIQFDFRKKSSERNSGNSVISQLALPDPMTLVSWAKNSPYRDAELLIQTNDKTLLLVSTDLKVLFRTKLSDKIQGEVYPIDYYKNKKLQYSFLAGRKLYVVDRLGNSVKGFPKTIPGAANPEFLSIVDYDNSRNYRFLMADEKGNLYMMDKEGTLLKGWDTKATGMKLFNAPRLVRTLGKDFIVAIDVQGTVFVFNRKGELIRGFPCRLGLKPSGDWFFEKSNTLDGALITVMSKEGTKAQVNLGGKVINKENFVRSSSNSAFSLTPAASLNDYVVDRVDNGKMAILNSAGKVLFEKENPGSDELTVLYVEFGAGDKLFCFRDIQQDFTYVVNEQGRPVFPHPLETTLMPAVMKSKEGIVFFTAYKNQLKKVFP